MSQTRNWWNMMKYLWWNHENPFFHPGTLTLPNLRITLWQSQVGSEHKNVCFVKQTFEKNAGGARTQGQHGRPSDAKKENTWKPCVKTTSCLLPFASRRLSSLLCFPCLWPIGRSPTLDSIVTHQKLLLHLLHVAAVAWKKTSCQTCYQHLVTNRLFPTAQNETTEHQLSKKTQKSFAISTCGLKRIFCVIN